MVEPNLLKQPPPRPLNSHGFTMCHTFSVPFSQSHGRFFISHRFTNFERTFSQTHSFLKKKKNTGSTFR